LLEPGTLKGRHVDRRKRECELMPTVISIWFAIDFNAVIPSETPLEALPSPSLSLSDLINLPAPGLIGTRVPKRPANTRQRVGYEHGARSPEAWRNIIRPRLTLLLPATSI
jgi:hypothetical protein